MADTIKVTLTPAIIEARPSTPVEAVITIQNTGPTVEEYAVELDGLPRAWYTLPAERIALFPNDRDEARITIQPVQDADLGAGAHPFTITVSARANPAERTTVQGTVRVAAAAALDAELRPSRVTGRKARYRVLLRNRGNAALNVDLDAYDSEEGCDFSFEPAMAQVGPGQKATVTMLVRPLHTRLAGPQHAFDFRVNLEPSLGAARPLQGQFIYKPRFRSWRPFVRLVTLAAVIGVLVIAAPFILPQLLGARQLLLAQPNASIGNVRLGATNPAAVAAAMGQGATTTNHDTVVTRRQQGGTTTARLRRGRVVSLGTTSPAVTTPGGVHVGSSVADVKKAFGAALAVVGGGTLMGIGPGHAGPGGTPTTRSGPGVMPTTSGGPGVTPTTSSGPGGAPTSGSGPGGAPTSGSGPGATPTGGPGSGGASGSGAMGPNPLAGGSLVLVGKATPNGQRAQTYFDLDRMGTHVASIRMGYYPWITPDHGGPTAVRAITATATWTLAGGPYLIGGDVRIPSGVTLTIRPGVHVYFTTPGARLYVDGGALHAAGTPDAPVVFTALNDQQHGAFDTLNRPAPSKAGWSGIGVSGAGGTLDLNNTEVYYGSSAVAAGDAEVYVAGGGNPTVSIQNSTIEAASGYGLNAANAPPGTVIRGDVFNADNYPLLINGGQSLDDSNLFAPKGEVHNTHNAVYVRPGATIAAGGATVVWAQQRVPFVLQGNETISPGGTLEIGPNVILKGYDAASGLTVGGGTLLVAGQDNQAILMTSYRDDGKGGDSDADGGAIRPQRGDWRGIVITGTSRVATYRLKVWWAGSNGRPALSIADHATARITRGEVAESAGDGLANGSDQPVAITSTSLHLNAGYGLNFTSPAAVGMTTLAGNRVAPNGKGGLALGDRPLPTPAAGAAPTSVPPTPNMGVPTMMAGATQTAAPGSATPAASGTPSAGPSATAMPAPQPSGTATAAPGAAATTPAPSGTATPAPSATATPTATPTPSPSATPAPGPSATATPAPSATPTAAAGATSTSASGDTPTATPSDTPTATTP